MALEAILQRFLQLLAKQIDATARQFVVQIRDDEIQGHLDFYVHDGGRFRVRFRVESMNFACAATFWLCVCVANVRGQKKSNVEFLIIL